MKKLSKEAKFNLKNGFGSLISNRSAIEAGKSMPVWLTAIMGILGPALAMVPIIVNVANSNGAAAFSDGTNYNLDRNLAIAAVDLNNRNDKLQVTDHLLTYYKEGTPLPETTTGKVEMDTYINDMTHQYEFRAYFLIPEENKTINDLYKEITSEEFVIGSTTLKSDTDAQGTKYYKPTVFVFHKDGFGFISYKADTTTAGGSFSGDLKNTKDCELIARIGTINKGTAEEKVISSYVEVANPNNLKAIKDNTKELLNEAYLENKARTFMYSASIYSAVYVGLVIMLGFLLFILTRGKKNFNNYLKWYQCLGISCWACISPGILALGLGFMLQSYAMMIFIFLMGIRIMWLTMKQLSPTYAG